MKIERILVPVDYSSCSRVALRNAVELAACLKASVEVVHVWDRPSYVSEVVLTRADPVSGKSLIRLIQDNAQHDLEEFLASCDLPASASFESKLLSGDPASALLHELALQKHDLVIVGTHGRTGLSHVLLGSVAEKLVRLSPVPVLTIPDKPALVARAATTNGRKGD